MAGLILDGSKLMWHKDRVRMWQEGKRIAPITIDMALTRACNYKCTYCYSKLQHNESTPLTWPILCRFLDDCKNIGVKAISLVSDGESTLHKDWVNFILAGYSRGLNMAIGTNGYNITQAELRIVLRALTYIRFNISAAGSKDYAKIHGVEPQAWYRVVSNIHQAVMIKRELNLPVTIGLQMVMTPDLIEQVLPLAELGKDLGVDYLVIKHCSDDENGSLGIDYSKYESFKDILRKAESMSTDKYRVAVKWSKILSGGKRAYSSCSGAQFIMQISGSGLVAPCGMLFNEKYKRYHIGNIAKTSFKELWQSKKYWEVMEELAGRGTTQFDAKTMCGSLCLQHKTNEFLDDLLNGIAPKTQKKEPDHINFI